MRRPNVRFKRILYRGRVVQGWWSNCWFLEQQADDERSCLADDNVEMYTCIQCNACNVQCVYVCVSGAVIRTASNGCWRRPRTLFHQASSLISIRTTLLCQSVVICFTFLQFCYSFLLAIHWLFSPRCAFSNMDTVQIKLLKRTLPSSPNPNALVAISKGMRALKLFSNEIVKFIATCYHSAENWYTFTILQKAEPT